MCGEGEEEGPELQNDGRGRDGTAKVERRYQGR